MSFAARPAAFKASCAFGAVGVLLLLCGWAVGSDTLFLIGLVAGSLSLVAALWWRSQLVAAWRSRKRG